MRTSSLLCLGVATLVSMGAACDGYDDGDFTNGSGGGGGDAPTTTSTTTVGGGGEGGEGTGGDGGQAPGFDCTGDWTAPATPILLMPEGLSPGSVAITRGELELYVVAADALGDVVMRAKRASTEDMFGALAPVPELSALCADTDSTYLDVSEDGKRAYVTCAQDCIDTDCGGQCPVGGCDVLYATRSGPDQDFMPSGFVGKTGFHLSLTGDELIGTSNGFALTATESPRIAVRSSMDVDFGPSEPIAGLESANTIISGTTLSHDTLELYAYVDGTIHRATRQSTAASFGKLLPLPAWEARQIVGAPDLTPDCRSIYAVHIVPGQASRIDVARR